MAMNTEMTKESELIFPGNAANADECAALPAEYHEVRWYAAYTSANHEKRVAEQMGVRGVEHFLPLYASVRQWKNGRVTLQRPLFPGYVFVRLALREKLRVQQIPGMARLVGFDGRPAALPDEEIETLRTSLNSGMRAEPHPYVSVGRRVRITAGPLAGREGILKRRKGNLRVVLSTELIQRSISVDIDASDVVPVQEPSRGSLPYCPNDLFNKIQHQSQGLTSRRESWHKFSLL
jgi:transcription antitermination factor NusG